MNSTGWASEVTSESVPGVSLPPAGRLDFLPAVRSATGRQHHISSGARRGRRDGDDSVAERTRASVAPTAGTATRAAHARDTAGNSGTTPVANRLASGSH
jgi:hypothetical protein